MKNKISLLFLFAIFTFAFSVNAEDTEIDITIPRAAICADIQNREPSESGTSFSANVGKVYFFTEIKSASAGKIKHAWYYKNIKVNELELEYKAGQYRTWSQVYIKPGQQGEWQAEATVNDTTVIKRLVFTITSEK